jgi:hypothetical protein
MSGAEKPIGVEREIEFEASPEAGEILAHDGAEGPDFFLAPFLQSLIESLDPWIMAHGRQGRHVERGAQVPDVTL